MRATRPIIEIDEDKCDGCGQCILSCAEGALKLVDGKAKLVGEIYCDGLGVCLGECPAGALTVVEREAEEFDEEAVEELLSRKKDAAPEKPAEETMACGCPGTQTRVIECGDEERPADEPGEVGSRLGHWPVKLQLLGPKAPFLKDADLVLLADCVAVAYPELHRKLLPGKAVAIGCPKLDDLEAHINRLADILAGASPRSLTVAHMEVPCCKGFVHAANQAIKRSGVDIPLKSMQIGVHGELMEEETLSATEPERAAR